MAARWARAGQRLQAGCGRPDGGEHAACGVVRCRTTAPSGTSAAARRSASPTGGRAGRLDLRCHRRDRRPTACAWPRGTSTGCRPAAGRRALPHQGPAHVLCVQETRPRSWQIRRGPAFDGTVTDRARRRQRHNGVAIAARGTRSSTSRARQGSSDDAGARSRAEDLAPWSRRRTPLHVVSVYVPTVGPFDALALHLQARLLDGLAERAPGWIVDGYTRRSRRPERRTDRQRRSTRTHFVGATHVTQPDRAAPPRTMPVWWMSTRRCGAPRARRFTWWIHGIGYSRNLGMRIDHITLDRSLAVMSTPRGSITSSGGGERRRTTPH